MTLLYLMIESIVPILHDEANESVGVEVGAEYVVGCIWKLRT